MNIEKRWVKMISMAALLLIVVSACDSDEDVESGDEGLYPGRIVDVNLQLDPLWIYEYTNRVGRKSIYVRGMTIIIHRDGNREMK